MSRKVSPYNQAINKLLELHKKYPNRGLGMHISTALCEYGDMWGVSDKEFLFALEKYEAELELDFAPDKDIDQIIKEGENLETLFQQEEEEDF